uniref:Phospholipase/Carboxylesterase n=1 Tax=uncultured bacterium 5E7 TaxID=1701324 RepID=A0A0N9HR60_9BACT|nr:phospholipase/Carboxylesterase [uncultured bacterium 5E7]
MLEHLTAWPRVQGQEPHPCLVLLHGRGSNEQDLFGLVPELPKQPLVVSVRAPFPFPWGGWFWYDLSGEQHVPDPETFASSMSQLREFLGELPARYPIDPARLYLLGFSQGALMSGCLTLAQPGLVRATAMLSGYLPLHAPLETDDAGVAGKPIFMAHGQYDNVLPVVMGRQARMHLETLKADVEYHEYPMDHQVVEQEMADLRRWFEGQGLT